MFINKHRYIEKKHIYFYFFMAFRDHTEQLCYIELYTTVDKQRIHQIHYHNNSIFNIIRGTFVIELFKISCIPAPTTLHGRHSAYLLLIVQYARIIVPCTHNEVMVDNM